MVTTARRRLLWPVVDLGVWIGAVLIAILLRFDFQFDQINPAAFVFVALVLVLHLAVGFTVGPYAIGHVNGSLEETIDIGRTVASVVLPSFVVNWFTSPLWVPRSVPLIAGMIAILAMFGIRFVVRLRNTRASLADDVQQRVIVFGAGRGGQHLIRSLTSDPGSALTPVAVLDDDPRKRRWRPGGIRVMGGRADLLRVAKDTGAGVLAVAIPSADSALLRELRQLAEAAELDLRVLPAPATCSAGPVPTICAASIWPTSWVAARSTSTRRRSPRPSPASESWSPARAAQSARNCAGRSSAMARRSWCSWTVTSPPCTPPRSP